eukprot:917538-Prymnesium_polylepis.1
MGVVVVSLAGGRHSSNGATALTTAPSCAQTCTTWSRGPRRSQNPGTPPCPSSPRSRPPGRRAPTWRTRGRSSRAHRTPPAVTWQPSPPRAHDDG